jgi:hypothetical protein
MWGINTKSCLCEITNLPLSVCLVQDPMHILLEGVAKNELQLLLTYLIDTEKYFTLQWLNTQISGFPYSQADKRNKPEQIQRKDLKAKSTLRQTAASMITLMCMLPIMIGSKVPEVNRKWINFIRLLQITLLCISPFVNGNTAAYLGELVFEYLTHFCLEYPKASVVPKMHYLLHLPLQMMRFGPLRNLWCMRFEAKHGFFKGIKWKNFKNLAFSLATRHQKWMCYMQLGMQGTRSQMYLYPGDVTKQGIEVTFAMVYPNLAPVLIRKEREHNNDIDEDALVYQTQRVEIHGKLYSSGRVIILGYDHLPETPKFGLLRDIIIIDQRKYFVIETIEIENFSSHINSYRVKYTGTLTIVNYLELDFPWPHDMYMYQSCPHIMLRTPHFAHQ